MILLNLFSDGTLLPSIQTLDLRIKTNITVAGERTDGGLIIVTLGRERAPIKSPIHASVAQLPRIDINPGETITLTVEADNGGRTRRWTSPVLTADRAGILHITNDERLYCLILNAFTQNDSLGKRLSALECAFADKNKRSKSPKIGGTKI